jgi:hypothetical protein
MSNTDNDLANSATTACKPACKKKSKKHQKRLQNMPSDLAEIIAVWPQLPEHIKRALKALMQTIRDIYPF